MNGTRTNPPLIAAVWQTPGDPLMRGLRNAVLVVAGVALLAISAKINVPLPMVPMTMQTLMVLLVGAFLGPVLGVVTVGVYLLLGAFGVPVFAGARTGLDALTGPTGGYLFGFLFGAWTIGMLAVRGRECTLPKLFLAMLLGHAVIVFIGFLWLAFGMQFGIQKAFTVGVVSFIAAAIFKSAFGALILSMFRRLAIRAGRC